VSVTTFPTGDRFDHGPGVRPRKVGHMTAHTSAEGPFPQSYASASGWGQTPSDVRTGQGRGWLAGISRTRRVAPQRAYPPGRCYASLR
jgi:hypothetical protein